MLGMSQKQIDASLTIALVAFAIAIPTVANGYLNAFYGEVKPVASGWRIFQALLTGAWVAEGFGGIAVAIGVYAVIAHLSLIASTAFIATIILVIVGIPFLSFIGLMIYAITQYGKQQQKPASGETPVQSKETTEKTPGNS